MSQRFEGKNLDDALTNASQTLGVERHQLTYHVLLQKRGFLGFMQKVLFFLPDAISSMTIDEKSGSMVTEAMVNTTVKEFETNRLYSVKIKE